MKNKRQPSEALMAQMRNEYASLEALINAGQIAGFDISKVLIDIAAEIEMGIIDEDGSPGLKGNSIVEAVDDRHCTVEFPRCAVEAMSDPIMMSPTAFHELYKQLLYNVRKLQREARNQGQYLLGIGFLSSFPESELSEVEKVVSRTTERYPEFVKYLGQRNGSYAITLNHAGKQTRIDVPSSPVPAGLCCGFQPCIRFHPEQIGLAANLTMSTAWAFALIGASSSIAFEEVAQFNSRGTIWKYGMDPEGQLSPFGPGAYYADNGIEAVLEWYRYVMQGEEVLEFSDDGTAQKDCFSALRHMDSTRWINTHRLRLGKCDGRVAPYLEGRVSDTSLTLVDDIANMAVYAGLMATLLGNCSDANELISYEDAETVYNAVLQDGDAEIVWAGKSYSSARQLILEQFIPMAVQGLLDIGIPDKFATSLVDVVRKRLESNLTASEWLTRALDSIESKSPGIARADAVRQLMLFVAMRQLDFPDALDELEGISDWDMP